MDTDKEGEDRLITNFRRTLFDRSWALIVNSDCDSPRMVNQLARTARGVGLGGEKELLHPVVMLSDAHPGHVHLGLFVPNANLSVLPKFMGLCGQNPFMVTSEGKIYTNGRILELAWDSLKVGACEDAQFNMNCFLIAFDIAADDDNDGIVVGRFVGLSLDSKHHPPESAASVLEGGAASG